MMAMSSAPARSPYGRRPQIAHQLPSGLWHWPRAFHWIGQVPWRPSLNYGMVSTAGEHLLSPDCELSVLPPALHQAGGLLICTPFHRWHFICHMEAHCMRTQGAVARREGRGSRTQDRCDGDNAQRSGCPDAHSSSLHDLSDDMPADALHAGMPPRRGMAVPLGRFGGTVLARSASRAFSFLHCHRSFSSAWPTLPSS